MLLFLLPLLLLWGSLIHGLGIQWTAFDQYSYGWAVPFLCLYLAWKRRTDCPPSATPGLSTDAGLPLSASGGEGLGERWPGPSTLNPQPSTAPSPSHFPTFPLSHAFPARQHPKISNFQLFSFLFLLLLLFPVRLLHEANPVWRLTSWAWATIAVTVTIALVYLNAGAARARHFAFPIAFFLVAVPWPSPLEGPLVQGLTRANTAVTVETLSLLGVPALQHGNVIEVGTGAVGIDDACSGIRSFQATLMLALFFGELYRLSALRRFLLCLAGFALSFLFNLARTTLLTWVAARKGLDAIASWHDPAGVVILLACFSSLWLLARLYALSSAVSPSVPPSSVSSPWSVVLGRLSSVFRVFRVFRGSSSRTARSFALLLFACLLLCEICVRAWYHVIDSRLPLQPAWTVQLPSDALGFQELRLPDQTRRTLSYDQGLHVAWEQDPALTWQMIYLRWSPGRPAAQFAWLHSPTACLPAVGMKVTPLPGIRSLPVADVTLPFQIYRVETAGRIGFVFFCRWGARGDNTLLDDGGRFTRWYRLRSVLEGRGTHGLQVLEVALWGLSDPDQALAAFQTQLARLLKPLPAPWPPPPSALPSASVVL